MQHGHQVNGYIITTLMSTTYEIHTVQCLTKLCANKTLGEQIHLLETSVP